MPRPTLATGLVAILAAMLLAVPVHAAGVDRYDPARDAQADLEAARAAASRDGRQVLVIVGGDWCRDCRDLDALFAADPSLAALRNERFVEVKLYVGTDNRNEAALARFPKLAWVPTLFVLDGDGRVVRHAASTAFHEGKALDPAKLRGFLAAR
jgi:thiol:disulfide interchange protein